MTGIQGNECLEDGFTKQQYQCPNNQEAQEEGGVFIFQVFGTLGETSDVCSFYVLICYSMTNFVPITLNYHQILST
jgi:hypothetical protein